MPVVNNALTIVLSVGVLWMLFLLVVPLIVKSAMKKPLESGFRVIDPVVDGLPQDSIPFFDAASTALQKLGFHHEFHLQFDQTKDLMLAYAAVMAHPVNRDLAMILDAVAPQKLRQIEFSTEFQSGGEINTNNGPQLPLNVVMKADKVVYWFPEIQDPATLYEAHLALCQARGGAKPPVPHGDALLQHIRQGILEDFDHATRSGVFRIDPHEGAYRLTTRGAYRLTYPNLFPFSNLMKARRRARDQKALSRATGR